MAMTFEAPESLGPGHSPRVTSEVTPKPRIDKEQVRAAALAMGADVVLAGVTGYPQSLFDGSGHPCLKSCQPDGGGKDRFNASREGTGAVFCNQCLPKEGTRDIYGTIMWIEGCDLKTAISRVADLCNVQPTRSGKPISPATGILAKEKPIKVELPDSDANLRHEVYTKLQQIFPLSEKHRQNLRDRGLTDAEINHRGYWTATAGSAMQLMQSGLWSDKVRIASTVPGVFPGGSLKLAVNDAMMIPVRDATGRVIATKVRLDNKPKNGLRYFYLSSKKQGGPSPGSPCHVPLPPAGGEMAAAGEVLRIVEAELKADIATARTCILSIGGGGAQNWEACKPIVEKMTPRKVILSPDADARTNKAVAKATAGLWEHFTTAEWSPIACVETWETDLAGRPNGIDDAIAAGVVVKQLSFKQSAEYVDKIRPELKLTDLLEDLDELEDPHDPSRLARLNVKRYEETHGGKLVFWLSTFWRYRQGCYRRIDDNAMNAKVRVAINQELFNIAKAMQEVADSRKDSDDKKASKPIKKRCISNSLVANVISELKKQCWLSDRVEMPSLLSMPKAKRQLVSLENGLLDLDRLIAGATIEDSITEHTPDWFSATQLDYAYQPGAQCPTFLRYLADALPDEASRSLIQEWAGYLLVPGNPYQRFLVVEGEGGTGKSVLLSGVLPAMIGPSNVSNVKLDGFGGNQFSLNDTIGKALNVDPDANEYARFNESLFKQFSIGEPVQFEPKGREPFSAEPTAKVMLGWNTRPRIKDKSQGIWRRMLLVGFHNKVSEDKKILSMDKAWYWRQSGELPGILLWAIEGLKRLHDQGGFTISEAMEKAVDNYRHDMNPIQAFLDEIVKFDAGSENFVMTQTVVASFAGWCADNATAKDAENMNPKKMGKAIKSRYPSARGGETTLQTGAKRKGFFGLKLLDCIEKKSSDEDADDF